MQVNTKRLTPMETQSVKTVKSGLIVVLRVQLHVILVVGQRIVTTTRLAKIREGMTYALLVHHKEIHFYS